MMVYLDHCVRCLVLFTLFYIVHSQTPCVNDSTAGLQSPLNSNNDVTSAGVNAVLLNAANKYAITCCGYIDQWQFAAKAGVTIGATFKGQIWEPGTPWQLVGENDLTVAAIGENTVSIATGNRITVKPNDVIGFYEPSESIVGGKGGVSTKESTFTGPETSYDWDSAPDTGDEFSINVRLQPSNTPSFTNLDDLYVMDSTIADGTVLTTLAATDADPQDIGNLVITQTGSTGSAATMFQYDTATQQVKVQTGVTMTPGDHTMTFQVTDGCLTASGTLTLRVENTPPVITSLSINDQTTISEDLSTKTLLHELIVTDEETVECSLDSTGVPFIIQPIPSSLNYGIYLTDGAAMDYYTRNAYILDLSCSDDYDSTSGVFTVYLTQNEPPIINSLPIGIDTLEQSVLQTTLYTFSVTDPENAPCTCTYTTTPTTTVVFLKPSANYNEFEIVLQSNPNLNYDVTRTYQVDIQCSDNRRSDTSVFFMNVLRNKPPVFSNLQNTTVVYGPTSHIGQPVYDVVATDPENDQLQYSITCIQGNNCPFEIFHSGEVVLTRSIKGETVPAYDLYVYVMDDRTTTGPRTLTVQISDINYAPLITNLPLPSALVVPENSPLDSSVFQVFVQDNDDSDVHTYSMMSVPSDGMLYFQIDPNTGLVKTSSTTGLNYESGSSTSFTLSITVTDTKDSDTQNLSLTMSDVKEAVLFTKKNYVLSIDEGLGGTALTDPGYLFTDQDTGDTHTFGMDCGAGVGYFTIASATGIVSLITDIDVDASGSATSYTCAVTVSDGSYKDTATLNLNINNINDNTPIFSSNLYTFYLDINTAVNNVFGSAVATDEDAGQFGTFTYSINQSSLGAETFAIQSDGDLYLKNSLTSYGYGQSFKFEVIATDTGGRQGSASVFIVIPELVTVTTPTNNDPYVTFWEYPANPAWLIVFIVMATVCFILPCYMIRKYGDSCSYKGRVGEELSKQQKSQKSDNIEDLGQLNLAWKPWMWFERKFR